MAIGTYGTVRPSDVSPEDVEIVMVYAPTRDQADLISQKIDPLAIRLLFMESHYRTQLNLTWESIEAAHSTLKRWRKKIASWPAGG